MKRLYTLLSLLLFFSTGMTYAQKLSEKKATPYPGESIKQTESTTQAKGGTLEVYWSEDFSNGFDGQGNNGEWTTEGNQGDLWFQTFPVGAENGYDPESPIEGYGDFLPNYFGNGDVVSSPTRDNGIMMLDADRYNSTSTSPDDEPAPNTTDEPIVSSLITPAIDLTGVEYADLCFYSMSFMCCQEGRQTNVDISFDSEESWQEVDSIWVGPNLIDQDYCMNLSSFLLESPDISNVKIRFRWPENISHYYWMLDDIKIQARPDNNIVVGDTWYNNYHELIGGFEDESVPAEEYYDSFEYLNTPNYLTRPLNFAIDIYNDGAEIQTGVKLLVTLTTPSGQVLPDFESESISLAQLERDTLRISNVEFGSGAGQIPIENGEYICEYRVIQNEDPFIPENNIGATKQFRISTEPENNGYTIFRNDADTYNGNYTALGENVIWSVPYVFSELQVENAVITHVETVFTFNEFFAETVPGSTVYFNIRSGSVLEENPDDPETLTTVFFDSGNPLDYDDESLEFEIQEDDIWNNELDGLPYLVWATFELPNPIMINAGEVYQVEYRVPSSSDNLVFPPVTGNQEKYAATVYDFNEESWLFLGINSIPFRMRITDVSSVNKVSYESGIQLLQNWPNPFNDVTRIQYRLDQTSDVIFEVFDLSGRLIYSEDHGRIPAGTAQTFEFDAKSMSSGVYTYSIVANGERVTRKLTIE